MGSKHIQSCLQEIEEKLNWGPSDQWTNQDFEQLVETIFEKTGANLSLTTLKRIWGRVDYHSSPSTSTLNVLAQYLGYDHWRDFQIKHKGDRLNKNLPNSIKEGTGYSFNLNQKVLLVIVVLVALSSLFFLIDRRQVFYDPSDVIFESKKVTTGLPNTVVFDYDVSQVIADSFHIQQSWDRRRRVRISPEDTQHTSFYYYPGYYHAKLIANDQIISEHEVLIESNGWTAMVERFPEPIYIEKLITENGYLRADLSSYIQNQSHFRDSEFWVDYYYVKDTKLIEANNFEYSCRIRNKTDLGGICRESRISVMCTKGRFNIPLCETGCVGNINLTLGDMYLQGNRHDLSGFGCNLDDWVDFRLAVVDKNCQIFINDELKFTKAFSADLGEIAGFKFKFNGKGEIDFVRVLDQQGELWFEEAFEQDL